MLIIVFQPTQRAVVRSVSDYISDLEFRYVPTKSRFSNVPQFCHDGYQWHPTSASIAAAAGIPYDHPFGPYRTEEDLLPSKFRARCRVGRGGRLVVDRIPVSVIHTGYEDEMHAALLLLPLSLL